MRICPDCKGTGPFYPNTSSVRRCIECARRYAREWAKAHPPASNYRQVREQAILAYGGKCNCCGESNIKFLGFDHIDGLQGNPRGSSRQLVFRLRKGGYTDPTIQVLCHNCNMAKGIYGACPHTMT
jgi:hypothetical protein